MKNKVNIFLTGGNGFIGKNIIEQLGEKYCIYAPTHKELDLLSTDKVEKFFQAHDIDVVIHTANIGGNTKEQKVQNILETNLRIFFNISRCSSYFKKMIHLGSGAEFGKQLPVINAREEALGERIPTDEYGFYKFIVAKFIEETDLPIYNLRIFGIFGKYEDYSFRFISNIIYQALHNQPIVIKKNAVFNYIYVDDFIRLLSCFIEHNPTYKSYNIGFTRSYKLLDLAKLILKIMKRNDKIHIIEKGFSNEYTCDITRLKNEKLPIRMQNIERSISELIEWYKNTI